ncbi:MAG: AAA family ATPase [Lachnospiraceae bacterium]|nr:AAA family ATPase [Lachnospiraceae bacterium]
MVLRIKNIGRFHNETCIDINGITILAGMNGTGKSTIGKALYCVFNSLYDCEKKIDDERRTSIYRMIGLLQKNLGDARLRRKMNNELTDFIYINPSKNDIIVELEKVTGISSEDIDNDIVERIKHILTVSDEDIINAILKKRIEAEFDMQVGHINYPGEKSEIDISIKGKSISIQIDDDNVSIKNKIELLKDIAYIDDPYVIDDMQHLFLSGRDYTHRTDIMRKLSNRDDERLSVIDDIIVNERLRELYHKIDDICGGEIELLNEDEYEYNDKRLKKRLSVKNLSTGMKSFAVIKDLLLRGYLEENGIVILDEPEAHLHPEWMLLYAEIIVLLQKILKINFVISTHSSEFLSYIELYTREYDLNDKCKYYLLKEDQKDSTTTNIFDCTDDVAKIYDVLTRSYIWASKELDLL